MNTTFNHLINHRALTTFAPIETELKLQPEKNYLFDLSYLGILDVAGDKAGEFLQGQLTCDVNSISDIQMIQGAQCNLKGRILSLIDVFNWKGIKLMLPKDLLEATINSLNKTAMLSRVSLKENKELVALGFYLQNSQDIVPDSHFFPTNLYALTYGADYCCFHLGNGFYIFIGGADFAETISKRFAEQQQLLGSLTWHSLRLARRQLEIYPDSRGMFLPHRLDLQQTPYLSFNKGCYKGQEIIARMHYKSTLKHQLNVYSIVTDDEIYSGQKLISETNGSEVGELVDYSVLAAGHYLVAVSILKGIESLALFEGHKKAVQLGEIPVQ
ncbi:folate-binding protein YgfZ [Legionella lytica]|uniref:Folate-binding protein YgfZ n=1 Tax=Legionella lytica TaxID=96232 RepID=A0ABW8D448_9GAMM